MSLCKLCLVFFSDDERTFYNEDVFSSDDSGEEDSEDSGDENED